MAENETMENFETEVEQSLVKVTEGDLVTGTVTEVSDTEVTVDLGIYSEGIIAVNDMSSNPRFSIKREISVGDTVTAVVLSEDDGEGHIRLSKKKADDILAWNSLEESMNQGTVLTVKVNGVVKAGVVSYVNGIRGFIPASQLSTHYVEDLNTFLNQTVDAKIITVDREKKRLVLSVKEVERDRAKQARKEKISQIQVGEIMEGKVETITSYGAFINLGDGISGLVHISQISQKRIASVNEVLKEGDTVKVKVIGIKEGKLSLSIKALQESASSSRPPREEVFDYKETGKATTDLGSILKNLDLKL